MLWQVIKSLETNKISLNHAGIGYTPENIDTEIEKIIGIVKQSTHKIYEDPTGPEADMRWVFIGDTTDHGPMFEIVLPEKKLNMRPHMQFDIDTDLSPDEVQERISENFGDDMLDWDLDIPGVGRVLSMGTYANTGLDMRI